MIPLSDPSKIALRKRLALEAYRVHRAIETYTHELRYLFWECTLRCNLRCNHCGSDCQNQANVPDMPLSTFLKVLDEEIIPYQNPAKVLLVLTGGEPTVRSDLVQCGQEFQRRGFSWGMVTNGWSMTPERWDSLVATGMRSLTVSLDGLAEVHDQFRSREGSFERALATLQLATRTPQLTFDAMTMVTPASLPQLPAIRDLLISSGVRRWRLDQVFPKGRSLRFPEMFLSDIQYHQMLTFIRDTRLQGQIRVDCGCDGFLGDWEGEVRHTPFFCRAGINVGSVLCDGSISACPSLRADYIQGNIATDSFRKVWEERYQNMRDRKWAKTEACAKCKQWKFCHGNGLHLRDEKTGKLAFCHLHKLQNAIRLESIS